MSLTLSIDDGAVVVDCGNGLKQVTLPEGGRYYELNGDRFWSVTTVIGGTLAKPHLVPWAARLAGKAGDMSAPFVERSRSATMGTLVHEYAEWSVVDGPENPLNMKRLLDKGLTDDEIKRVAALARGFDNFVEDYKPNFWSNELTVLNRNLTYAGTIDFVAQLLDDKEPVIADIKTSKHTYGEWALQLAAYGHATSAWHSDEERLFLPGKRVRRGVILHLVPDGYSLYPVDLTDELFGVFKHLRAVWAWRKHEEDTVLQVGVPLAGGK